MTIRFPTRIDYDWNGSGWTRTQSGRRHVDSDGAQIAPTNVIVQFVTYKQSYVRSELARGRRHRFRRCVDPDGGQDDPRLMESQPTTSRSRSTPTPKASPITLTPGTTWIELPRPGTAELR